MNYNLRQLVEDIKLHPVYVFVGPSGAGKDSVIRNLHARDPARFIEIPSVTTRPAYEGEVDGVNHHFISCTEFENMKANGDLLFSGSRYGFYYGTDRRELECAKRTGKVIILQTSSPEALNQIYEAIPYARTVSVIPVHPFGTSVQYENELCQRIGRRQINIGAHEMNHRLGKNLADMSFYSDEKN